MVAVTSFITGVLVSFCFSCF